MIWYRLPMEFQQVLQQKCQGIFSHQTSVQISWCWCEPQYSCVNNHLLGCCSALLLGHLFPSHPGPCLLLAGCVGELALSSLHISAAEGRHVSEKLISPAFPINILPYQCGFLTNCVHIIKQRRQGQGLCLSEAKERFYFAALCLLTWDGGAWGRARWHSLVW